MTEYKCEPCKFSTKSKYSLNSHLNTNKHKTTVESKKEETNKPKINDTSKQLENKVNTKVSEEIDQLKKQLENKEKIIKNLKMDNADLKTRFDIIKSENDFHKQLVLSTSRLTEETTNTFEYFCRCYRGPIIAIKREELFKDSDSESE